MSQTIFFIGDDVPSGLREQSAASWTYWLRLGAKAQGVEIRTINLGSPGDTVALIAQTWREACTAHFAANSGAGPLQAGLVFAFGNADMTEIEGAGIRTPFLDLLADAAAALREAAAWQPTLWIGPRPVLHDLHPAVLSADGQARCEYRNDWTAALNVAFGRIADSLDIPYLDLFTPLVNDPRWARALRFGGNGIEPNAAGHELVAELIARWPAWRSLIAGEIPVVTPLPEADVAPRIPVVPAIDMPMVLIPNLMPGY